MENKKIKKCYKCGIIKNLSEFYSNKSKYDNKSSECKDCSKLNLKNNRKKLSKRPIDESKIPDYKRCPKCNTIKSKLEFNISKRNADFLNIYCKECRKKEYIKRKNKDKISIKSKICSMCSLEKNINFFNKCCSSKDGHGWICKECQKIKSANYYKNNPEVARQNSKKRKHKIRALKYNKNQVVNKQEIEEKIIYQNYKCFYCGKDISKEYHIDHYIPISKGGDNLISNIVISCPKCNLSKNNKMPDEFIKYLENNK